MEFGFYYKQKSAFLSLVASRLQSKRYEKSTAQTSYFHLKRRSHYAQTRAHARLFVVIEQLVMTTFTPFRAAVRV